MKGTGVARSIAVGACAIAFFAFTAIYRFNTLGGAFAGFDNDHFLHFAYAKQVQAGERPLADFDDLALQGAWPYPMYSLSAAAQNMLGNTLRSEALLTIAGVAIAVVATLVAACLVAPLAVAALVTAFTVLVGPTLYNYPKVLMLSVGVLLIVLYARAPSRGRLLFLSVLAAVAFAFRHDYIVYVAVGTLAVFATTASHWRSAARHAVLYVALTTALLLPSLADIQRNVGLVNHVRDGLSLSRSEADRTPLSWPVFASVDRDGQQLSAPSFLRLEQNATTWLYYSIRLLPFVLVWLLWRTRFDPGAKGTWPAALALATMLMCCSPLLLRGNLPVRFGDIGPVYAVVLAATLAIVLRRRTSEAGWKWASRIAVVAVFLAATSVAVWTVGSATRQLDTAALSISPQATWDRSGQLWKELAALPAAYWSDDRPTPFVRAVQYLNRCSAPADRLVIMPYVPELLPLADRRFAGGRSAVLPGFLTDAPHQRRIVERWQKAPVPIVLVDEEQIYEDSYKRGVPILDAYLNERYVFAGRLQVAEAYTVRVFADRGRTPTGSFGDTGLPCFR